MCVCRSTVGEMLCMRVCVYGHTHVCMDTHMCVWTHTDTHTDTHECMNIPFMFMCFCLLVCPCGIDRCSCLSTGGLLREFGDLWHDLFVLNEHQRRPVAAAAGPWFGRSADNTGGSVAVREDIVDEYHGCAILLQKISLFKLA